MGLFNIFKHKKKGANKPGFVSVESVDKELIAKNKGTTSEYNIPDPLRRALPRYSDPNQYSLKVLYYINKLVEKDIYTNHTTEKALKHLTKEDALEEKFRRTSEWFSFPSKKEIWFRAFDNKRKYLKILKKGFKRGTPHAIVAEEIYNGMKFEFGGILELKHFLLSFK